MESVGNPKGCPSDVGNLKGYPQSVTIHKLKSRKGKNMETEALNICDSGDIVGRKRKKLTAQEKWQIFLETTAKNAPVGEILRRHGLYSSELTKIRKDIESAALAELGKKKYSRKPDQVSREEYEKIKTELSAKVKALAQMGEEYLILKKRTD